MKAYLLCMIPLAMLAACGGPGPVSDDAGNSASLPAPETSRASDPSGAAPQANAAKPPRPATGPGPAASAAIPAALHGRWGMTPDDCTSTRGDDKGLLTISAGELRFYESRAVPTSNVQSSPQSFSADFAFTGEGMEWTKFQTLQLQDDKLVRTESNPTTSYTYARCG